MYMDQPTYLRIIQTTRAPYMTLSDDQLMEMYLLANKNMIDYANALMKLQMTVFDIKKLDDIASIEKDTANEVDAKASIEKYAANETIS